MPPRKDGRLTRKEIDAHNQRAVSQLLRKYGVKSPERMEHSAAVRLLASLVAKKVTHGETD